MARRSSWWWLVFWPRILSPLIIAMLLVTTRLQIGWLLEGRNVWMNGPCLIIGVGTIALNLDSIAKSWLTWTWRGELHPRHIRRGPP